MKKLVTELAIYTSINALLPLGATMITRSLPILTSYAWTSFAVAGLILLLNIWRMRFSKWHMGLYALTIILNLSAFLGFGMLTYIRLLVLLLR